MYGVNNFAGKCRGKIHFVIVSKGGSNAIAKENIFTSEEVDKGTKILDGMKEAVVTIHRKDSDNFEGQYEVSTGRFNLDHEFLKRKFSTLEPDFYNFFIKRILKVNICNGTLRRSESTVIF